MEIAGIALGVKFFVMAWIKYGPYQYSVPQLNKYQYLNLTTLGFYKVLKIGVIL